MIFQNRDSDFEVGLSAFRKKSFRIGDSTEVRPNIRQDTLSLKMIRIEVMTISQLIVAYLQKRLVGHDLLQILREEFPQWVTVQHWTKVRLTLVFSTLKLLTLEINRNIINEYHHIHLVHFDDSSIKYYP